MAACLCGELGVGRLPLLRWTGHVTNASEWRGGQAMLGKRASVGSPRSQHTAAPCKGCGECQPPAPLTHCRCCAVSCPALPPQLQRRSAEAMVCRTGEQPGHGLAVTAGCQAAATLPLAACSTAMAVGCAALRCLCAARQGAAEVAGRSACYHAAAPSRSLAKMAAEQLAARQCVTVAGADGRRRSAAVSAPPTAAAHDLWPDASLAKGHRRRRCAPRHCRRTGASDGRPAGVR